MVFQSDRGNEYEKIKAGLKGRNLPLLFLDLEIFHSNLAVIEKQLSGLKIRFASKSIRSSGILKKIMDFSTIPKGILCYCPREAVFLSNEGFDDLLVAYPTTQAPLIRDVGKEILKGKKIILMVDSLYHLDIIQKVGEELGITYPVSLDIDVSLVLPGLNFGVYRSPLRNLKIIKEFISAVKKMNRIKIIGIMGYEAQVAGLGDFNPAQGIKNPIIRFLKKRSIDHVRKLRGSIVKVMTEEGFNLEFINGGGTGSINSTKLDPVVTEISVGSGIYSPVLFDYYLDYLFRPSLFYALEVSREPYPNILTLTGGGYMASGSIGRDRLPVPILPQGLSLTENEGVGEVQTPILVKGNKGNLRIGDPVIFRHAKSGEVCERFKEIWLYSGGKLIDSVPTYRGMGMCFI
jgi:D-serine deaminase-like pyridoxal phosphate-dependent protein